MRLAHLAFLFACFALPMYLMGYPSPFLQLISAQENQALSIDNIITLIASNMLNVSFAAGVFGLALGIAALTGFSAIYVVAALILSVVVNFVLIPSSYFTGGQCSAQATICIPSEIGVILTIFFNMILLLAVVEYIRGGG